MAVIAMKDTVIDSSAFGVWRSLVARFVRDEEVVGSNPATPTNRRGTVDLGPSPCTFAR